MKKIDIIFDDFTGKMPIRCEYKGSTLIAYKFLRDTFKNNAVVNSINELKYCGIYILQGTDDNGNDIYYIGRSVGVSGRVKIPHGIPDWKSALFVTTKDDSLNNTDIIYLEKALINSALTSNKNSCVNKAKGDRSKVSDSDIAVLDTMADITKFYAYGVGYTAFVPVDTIRDASIFYCNRNQAALKMKIINNKYTILEGSMLSMLPVPATLNKFTSKNIKENRIKYKDYYDASGKVTKNIPFDKPSQASEFGIAYTSNGKKDWKNVNGKKLVDIYPNI